MTRPWQQAVLAPFATPEACARPGVWCVCRAQEGVWSLTATSIVKGEAITKARAILAGVEAPAHADVAVVSPQGGRVHVPRPRRTS